MGPSNTETADDTQNILNVARETSPGKINETIRNANKFYRSIHIPNVGPTKIAKAFAKFTFSPIAAARRSSSKARSRSRTRQPASSRSRSRTRQPASSRSRSSDRKDDKRKQRRRSPRRSSGSAR